jgi:translation initiation factor IF-2
MQQRQLRLGDILDDYCPRERRITNHAVVAMVDQDVKQTRCTTCDAEHEYKQAKVPPQRKKKPAAGALYQEVLAGMPRRTTTPPTGPDVPDVNGDTPHALTPDPLPENLEPGPGEPALEPGPGEPEPFVPAAVSAGGASEDVAEAQEVDGPVHRQLIRATLPRPVGEVPARPAPEFTIRQPTARPGTRFRPGGPRRPGGPVQGQGGGGFRFGSRRGAGAQAGPADHGNRARPGPNERPGGGQRRRGGKKRSK